MWDIWAFRSGLAQSTYYIFITLAVYYSSIRTLERIEFFYCGDLPRYFYNIGPRAQCYKTFYHGYLPPFHGHTIILCYKATLPW